MTRTGERPTKALRRGGVQYVEMRSLDVSAFDPVGVNQNKLRFLEAFAAFCVLRASARSSPPSRRELDGNHALVAREGRRAGTARFGATGATSCCARGRSRSSIDARDLRAAGRRRPAAPVRAALALQEAKITDPALTPAARTLAELQGDGESFFDLALRMSRMHRSYFLDLYSPNESRQQEFAQEAEASLAEQARIEASDRLSFDEYLRAWFAA